jgi:hypothetical protein
MKKSILSGLFLSFISLGVFAQTPVVPQQIRAVNTAERIFGGITQNPGANMPLMPMEKPSTIGDPYLNRTWNKTTFMLYGSEKLSEGYLTRYDLLGQELDLYLDGGVKVIKADKIRSFVWIDSVSGRPEYFMNGKDFKSEDGVPFTGFFEVVTEGKMPIFRKPEAKMLESNFNATLNIGRRDNEISKRSALYYMDGDLLRKVPSSMKKITALFGEHEPQMKAYVKLNALRADTERDLILLFRHYEATTKQQ